MDEVMEQVKPLYWDAVLDSPIPLKVLHPCLASCLPSCPLLGHLLPFCIAALCSFAVLAVSCAVLGCAVLCCPGSMLCCTESCLTMGGRLSHDNLCLSRGYPVQCSAVSGLGADSIVACSMGSSCIMDRLCFEGFSDQS